MAAKFPVTGRKGEAVTCENGHECLRLSRDVRVEDVLTAGLFEGVNQPAPAVGDPVPTVCATCGSPISRHVGQRRFVFRFRDGWR